MYRQTSSRCDRRRGTRGFTMIELMVVIVIIGVLIGILVPAVSAVRKTARVAATKGVLTALDTGLTTLKTDTRIGGTFPPSASDLLPDHQVVRSPYTNDDIQISGAGLLVWALSGADLLGTPGFQVAPGYDYWGQSTGSEAGDLYYIDSVDNSPKFSRSGPYVDSSKIKISESDGTGHFLIPAETKASGGEQLRDYPMYLDAFGYPVLYWRADPAGKQLAERSYDEPGPDRGRYHWLDNAALLDADEGVPLHLSAAGTVHKLGWDDDPPPPYDSFYTYILDEEVWNATNRVKLWPHKPDDYLLVSPGYDGLYGTADDIANFNHNGR